MRRLMRITTPALGGVCFCCLRQDDGVGVFATSKPQRVAWSCLKHVPLGRKAFAMSAQQFDRLEKLARKDAGSEAGAYLNHLKVTDLSNLTPEEWDKFCGIMINAFGDAMEKHINNGEAPF